MQFRDISYIYDVGQSSPLVPKYFLITKRNPYPISSHSPPSSPQTLATTTLLPVSVALSVLGISYEWNHIICDLFRLASFTRRVFKIHPHCSMYQRFTPFYDLIIFCYLFVHVYGFELFQASGGREQCRYEHSCISVCSNACSIGFIRNKCI